MLIGYVVHNLNDPAVERRCRMFTAGGAKIKLGGFARDEALRSQIREWDPLVLGQSRDAALVRRALDIARMSLFPAEIEHFFRSADILVARNLEQLILAARIAKGRPLVYECLDIHRLLVGSGPASKLVRGLEAQVLPKVDLLISSSPAFAVHHFDTRPLSAPTLLVENKVLSLEPDAAPLIAQSPCEDREDGVIRIGWFGMLRCRTTLAFMTRLANQGNGRIQIVIGGKPSAAELPDFEDCVDQVKHITYIGPYGYDELESLYGACDFAWTIDWFEEGLNSSWLLPNRIYEALAFGAVPIGLRDIEIGRWLGRHDVGLLVADADEAIARLLAMSAAELAGLKAGASAIARAAVVADVRDCEALVTNLSSLL
ncbi:MAG: hypothetical protein WBA51_18520 [Erythrobacter sp.]